MKPATLDYDAIAKSLGIEEVPATISPDEAAKRLGIEVVAPSSQLGEARAQLRKFNKPGLGTGAISPALGLADDGMAALVGL